MNNYYPQICTHNNNGYEQQHCKVYVPKTLPTPRRDSNPRSSCFEANAIAIVPRRQGKTERLQVADLINHSQVISRLYEVFLKPNNFLTNLGPMF
jgi:hypothetical protein